MTHVFARVAPHEERPLVDERVSEIKADIEAEDYPSAVRALRRAIRLPRR